MTIWSGFRGKSGRDSREVEQMVSGRIFDTRRISRISLGVILLSVSTAGCGQDMSISSQESFFSSNKQTDPCRSIELEVLSPIYNIFFTDPKEVYFKGEVIKLKKVKTVFKKSTLKFLTKNVNFSPVFKHLSHKEIRQKVYTLKIAFVTNVMLEE